MKQISTVTIILTVLVVAYRSIAPIAYEKDSGIMPEEFECSKRMAHAMMDNPIERVPLTKIHIGRSENGGTTAVAYFFVFPYTGFSISEGCSSAFRLQSL